MGHHARNWVLDTKQAAGTHLMALDDDEYTPDAIAIRGSMPPKPRDPIPPKERELFDSP